jgi:hypothetical protein
VLAYELAQRGLRTVSQQAIPVVYGTIRSFSVSSMDWEEESHAKPQGRQENQ